MTSQDKHRRAIALEYDGYRAPRISAIGSGELADQIVELARQHGVPMMENDELAQLLGQLELGDEIPEMLYRCVAQIIAFAYRVRGRFPEGWRHEDEPSGSVYDANEECAGDQVYLAPPDNGSQ